MPLLCGRMVNGTLWLSRGSRRFVAPFRFLLYRLISAINQEQPAIGRLLLVCMDNDLNAPLRTADSHEARSALRLCQMA